jgi:hypothetical protein
MDEGLSDEPLEPWLPEWIEAAAEAARTVALSMLHEQGRGAVLVGVARVDTALEALLRAALAPPRSSETLFQTDRPLGSFGARIALAARLGLIHGAVEQSLHSLRRVRNAFAHSTGVVRLADPPYRDRLRESVAPIISKDVRRNPLWEPMQMILSDHMAGRSDNREPPDDARLRDFILLITILVAFLETAAHTITPLRPALTITFEQGITPLEAVAAPAGPADPSGHGAVPRTAEDRRAGVDGERNR